MPTPTAVPPPPPPPQTRSFASVAACPPSGGWKVAQSMKATKATKKNLKSVLQPTIDQHTFELVHGMTSALTPKDTANLTSAITRALHQRKVSNVRVDRVWCTDKARLIGVTSPTSSLQDLLKHRDMVLKAACRVLRNISDIAPKQRWKWIRIHNIPLDQYMGGGGGLKKLRKELEAENAGVRVPAEIRWLSGAKARARFHCEECGSSSVVAAVLSTEVFNQLCRRGIRLPGGRHEVDAFEEERPDALCLRCGEWGHVTPHCEAKVPKCAICAKGHTTKDHQCPVKGCRVGSGRMCIHTTAKCANCGGPHGARADACVAKRIAQHASRGWRSPPPP